MELDERPLLFLEAANDQDHGERQGDKPQEVLESKESKYCDIETEAQVVHIEAIYKAETSQDVCEGPETNHVDCMEHE